jgi:hypothetical protein
MSEEQTKKQREIELISEFMDKFRQEMGFYPTVVINENIINRDFPFKLPLQLLEKQFDDILPSMYGRTVTITCKKRIRPIVELRCFFSFIARSMGYSLTDIGKYMKKDHTTIINHIKTFNNLYETQENFRDSYIKIVNKIKRLYELSAMVNPPKVENKPKPSLFS